MILWDPSVIVRSGNPQDSSNPRAGTPVNSSWILDFRTAILPKVNDP